MIEPRISDKVIDTKAMGTESYLIGLINRFNNRFQTVADAMFEGISWKQEFFLRCVTLFHEPPTIKDMAEAIGCSHQNAKQILSKLEKGGLVEIRQDCNDRRKQRIVATEKASSVLEQCREQSATAKELVFANINPEDLHATIRVLTTLDERLKKYQEEAV